MRSGVKDSLKNESPVRGGIPHLDVPAYAGRYKIIDLLKLQFSKIAKSARRTYFGLMTRPQVEFHTEHRFSENLSNREYRRRWYRNHRGRFIASDHKRVTVLTSRPGPGPLVKAALFLRKEAGRTARVTARREKSNLRSKGLSGPVRPVRLDPVLTDSVKLTSRPSTVASEPRRSRRYGEKILMKTSSGQQGTYTRQVGGLVRTDHYFSDPPPRGNWEKYWYFFRKHGRWRVSEHHPYGDEAEVISQWLQSGSIPE